MRSVWRTGLLWAGPILETSVLAGLMARRRVQRAVTLPVLLVALVLSDGARGLWAGANTWAFWFAKELAHALLFLILGVEIAVRVFRPLPGVRRTLRLCLVVVVAVAAVLALTLPMGARSLVAVPRLLLAIGLFYAGVYGILIAHMIPVDPLHKTVLLGFAPYHLFNAVSWGQVQSEWEHALVNVANPVLFVLVLLVLLAAAWRDEAAVSVRSSLVRRLWSWR
jgi:hypothetical protein